MGVSFDLHVLGMPPAFVLSQNQTLKLMYDLTSGEYPKPGRHLWEPFLHKYTNWCVCVLGHLLVPPGKPDGSHIKERHKFDRPFDTQRLSKTGPPPTCPFI